MTEHWRVSWNVAGLPIFSDPFGIEDRAVSEEPSGAFTAELTCDLVQDEGVAFKDAARECLFLDFHVLCVFSGLLFDDTNNTPVVMPCSYLLVWVKLGCCLACFSPDKAFVVWVWLI